MRYKYLLTYLLTYSYRYRYRYRSVRVYNNPGGFRVEMQRDAHQPRTITCRYDPTEPGTYVVQVMWSGAHVPGSPFVVHIGATRSDLERLLVAAHHADQQQQQQVRDGGGGMRAVSRQSSRSASDPQRPAH